MKNLLQKIQRKDLVYFIIILVIVNLLVISAKVSNNLELINYFSFAGTLISIILAVIAIIYSFLQNSVQTNSTIKLLSSIDKIEEVTNELKKVGDLESLILHLENLISDSNSIVAEGLEYTRNDIRLLMSYYSSDGSAVTTEASDNVCDNLFKDEKFNFSHIYLPFCLYYFYKLYLSHRPGDISNFLSYIISETKNTGNLDTYSNFMAGIIQSFSSIGAINYNIVNDKLDITYFSEQLIIRMLKEVEIIKNSKMQFESPHIVDYTDFIKIESYFNE